MEDIPRIPSGMLGHDRKNESGFPTPMIPLLEGEPWTGRSTFALQMPTNRLLQVDKDREGMSTVTLEQDIIGSIP